MKNPVDLHIGQRVRHRRWLTGMTQQNLAEAIGIRFQQVQKYESGANRISAARLWEIARALGVPISFFYGGMDGARGEGAEDPMDAKETYELVRAYYGMANAPRRELLGLIQALNVAAAEPATTNAERIAAPAE
ncbi:MAG: helix-turn-helix transcriptional regulator [Micropepsaceae bacterium]|jgi:transcriptional regulator with XRE-family HTH domain